MRLVLAALLSSLAASAFAAPPDAVTVTLQQATASGPGEALGTVRFADAPKGVTIDVDLHGLTPGQHGLHLHQNPDCGPTTAADGKVTPAGAAGPHLDPAATGMHAGPEGAGHLGDLPRIEAGADGTARVRLVAPRLSVAALKGHALMLHAGGDNYADQPAPLGGGGARFACGVVGS